MATSNSRNFTQTRDDIIKDAFEDAGIYGANETVEDLDIQKANRLLNKMIKAWQSKNVGLWKVKEGALFPAYNQASYDIGLTSTDHFTTSYKSTTISADEAAAQTVLSLTSTTGMTAADNIGIELDDGTRQWTTIVSVDSSTQVTVTDALTGAAASGNTVIAYTSKINRPLEIPNARRMDLTTASETKLEKKTHAQYFELNNKTQTGSPNLYHYDRQLTLSKLYLWSVPSNVNEIIKFTYHDVIEDFDNPTDNADFPEEWLEPITDGLAWRLSKSGYGVPKEKRDELQATAERSFELAKSFDTELGSLQVVPASESC